MRVVIIDDDKLVCSSLKTIIEAHDIEVVGVGNDGQEAISLYEQYHPDILLTDIRMDGKNGLETSKYILGKYPDAKILFLTTFHDDEYIMKALQMGVKGYLLKQDYDSIVPALRSVQMGQSVFHEKIMAKITSGFQGSGDEDVQSKLGERNIQLISLIAKGMNNKEIAQTLYLSEGTVRNYVSTLLVELGLRDRTQLAIFYYQNIMR